MSTANSSADSRMDLELIDARIDARLARFRAELAAERLEAQTSRVCRGIAIANATMLLAVATLAFLAGRLA